MPISINGTTGISGVDGSAAAPALQGSDTNTGIAFGSDVIIGSTGGTERFRCDSSGRVLVGTTTPTVSRLFVSGGSLSVSGSDNDFAGGGNRVFIDHDLTNVRFGATGGGTTWTRGISLFTSSGSTTNTEVFNISSNGSFSAVIPSGGTRYPAFFCRAWVNFNGTGVVAIRASGNVSSITDNGTGDYTVNFTTALADASYAVNFSCGDSGQTGNPNYITGLKTPGLSSSSFRFMTLFSGNVSGDFDTVCVAVFR